MAKKSSPTDLLSGLSGIPGLSNTSSAESGAHANTAIGDFIVGGTKSQLTPLVWVAIAAAAVAIAFALRG